MASFLSDFFAACAPHDASTQSIMRLAQWLSTSGRIQIYEGYEDEPDIAQAYLWPKDIRDQTTSDVSENALHWLSLRAGPGQDLGHWMAQMPASITKHLSSFGQDGGQVISGFALWTPEDGSTQVVHITTPCACAAPIGTPDDFLRALSLPIEKLSDALKTGVSSPAKPNPAYRDWLCSIGLTPADHIDDALPARRPPEQDAFRDWLRSKGYNNKYFMTGQI